jgi:predicted O-methyltransferase YrrM
MTFNALGYWERRYGDGGTSGAGSRGQEAIQKVQDVQAVIDRFGAKRILDLGCGDGFIAEQLKVESYTGFDPAPSALKLCRDAMPGRTFKHEMPETLYAPGYDLTMSLDVMFHLVDDEDYGHHLGMLLGFTKERALVYATNHEERGAAHVRHRRWTADIPLGWDVTELPSVGGADPRKRTTLLTWKKPAKAEDVQGLIPLRVGIVLETLARTVKAGQIIVEIGGYTGRSTAFLARGAGAGVSVTSIDPHGLPGCERGKNGRFAGDHVRSTYLRNLHDVGAISKVTPVRALSSKAPLPQREIGMLWIDGDHSKAAVMQDIERWAPLVAPGGYIVLDDVGTWHPGVDEAVRRLKADPRWTDWKFAAKPLAYARRVVDG